MFKMNILYLKFMAWCGQLLQWSFQLARCIKIMLIIFFATSSYHPKDIVDGMHQMIFWYAV